jgi:Nif-specific regulatory protein
MNPSEAALLAQVGRILQTEGESFPSALQRVLGLLEEVWFPLRAAVTLAGGLALVTGKSEFPSGGSVASVPVVRGKKILGTLSFEIPPGERLVPVPSADFEEALAVLVAQEAEVRRLTGLAPPVPGGLVGSSGVMQEVFRLVEKVAGTSATVLLLGESGVGKELLAGAIHRRSRVSQGPFVLFNGTALPESMVESELFGHAKGLGGRFEEAHGGTLFLDEVGELSLPVQARLLRVLEDRAVGRKGSSQPVSVDLRIIASTSRSLEKLIANGRFRPDLYARLAAFPIQVPPLRDRGSDIVALADHFVTQFSLQTGKEIKRISTPTLEMLLTYPWPGNVRELENVMERAVLLSDDEVIHGYHLPPSLQSSVHSGTRMHGRLADRLDSLEYEMLVEALKASQGNITQAARELGLTKRIMGLRLKKFELDYRTFRQAPSDLASDFDRN